jgi:hypothetical protein
MHAHIHDHLVCFKRDSELHKYTLGTKWSSQIAPSTAARTVAAGSLVLTEIDMNILILAVARDSSGTMTRFVSNFRKIRQLEVLPDSTR